MKRKSVSMFLVFLLLFSLPAFSAGSAESKKAEDGIIEITYYDTLLTEKEAPMVKEMAAKYMELHPM